MKNIFAIYKPKGPTSHDIIDELRKITGVKKIGHAGTLDPLASGVLVVGIGRQATKKLAEIVAHEKEYLAEIKLGERSSTDDQEGQKEKVAVEKVPTLEDIQKVIQEFEGEIKQVPPLYSAVKVHGREAYKLARQGHLPQLKPRRVIIKKIGILDYRWPYLKLKIVTGPGVYIRSLARDLGEKLGTGGYLAELERTRVGKFRKQDALTLKQFAQQWQTR